MVRFSLASRSPRRVDACRRAVAPRCLASPTRRIAAVQNQLQGSQHTGQAKTKSPRPLASPHAPAAVHRLLGVVRLKDAAVGRERADRQVVAAADAGHGG